MLKKNKRIIDKDYILWIKSLNCIICGYHETTAHHIKSGGKGVKDHDRNTIPLCHNCHMSVHQIGRDSFSYKHGLNMNYVVERLNEIWESQHT